MIKQCKSEGWNVVSFKFSGFSYIRCILSELGFHLFDQPFFNDFPDFLQSKVEENPQVWRFKKRLTYRPSLGRSIPSMKFLNKCYMFKSLEFCRKHNAHISFTLRRRETRIFFIKQRCIAWRIHILYMQKVQGYRKAQIFLKISIIACLYIFLRQVYGVKSYTINIR